MSLPATTSEEPRGFSEQYSSADPVTDHYMTDTFHSLKPWSAWVQALFLILGITGLPGNILTFLAFVKEPKLRGPTNLLILNLALNDFFSCLGVQLFIVFNFTSWGIQYAQRTKYACLWSIWGVVMSGHTSIVSILVITCERFLSVMTPVFHKNWTTAKTVGLVIVGSWLAVLTISFLPMLGWNTWKPGNICDSVFTYPPAYMSYVMYLSIFLCMIAMAILNLILMMTVRKRFNKQHPSEPGTGHSISTNQQHLTSPQRENQVTRLVLAVVGIFYLTWFPFIILSILVMVFDPPPQDLLMARDLCKPILIVGSTANPIIYTMKKPLFRKTFKKILSRATVSTSRESS